MAKTCVTASQLMSVSKLNESIHIRRSLTSPKQQGGNFMKCKVFFNALEFK